MPKLAQICVLDSGNAEHLNFSHAHILAAIISLHSLDQTWFDIDLAHSSIITAAKPSETFLIDIHAVDFSVVMCTVSISSLFPDRGLWEEVAMVTRRPAR